MNPNSGSFTNRLGTTHSVSSALDPMGCIAVAVSFLLALFKCSYLTRIPAFHLVDSTPGVPPTTWKLDGSSGSQNATTHSSTLSSTTYKTYSATFNSTSQTSTSVLPTSTLSYANANATTISVTSISNVASSAPTLSATTSAPAVQPSPSSAGGFLGYLNFSVAVAVWMACIAYLGL